MNKIIDFRLFPDVEGYSNYDSINKEMTKNTNIPFLRAYNDCPQKNILLLGQGSLGKSTSLRIFEADRLCCGIACCLYECKNISNDIIKEIEKKVISRVIKILIFDAYDELRVTEKNAFFELIKKVNETDIQVIISSRYDMRYEKDGISNRIFDDYYSINMYEFSFDQLDSIVSPKISRYGGYFRLLRNTMLLSMHRELEREELLGSLADSIKTETEFIKEYLSRVYFSKMGKMPLDSYLRSLGEYVHNQREKPNGRRDEIEIPAPLKHIFFYKEGLNGEPSPFLEAFQIKLLNYLHASYITHCFISKYDDAVESPALDYAAYILSMPSTVVNSEVIYYFGQLLSLDKDGGKYFARICPLKSNPNIRYENLLCLMLGYNNDIAEDIPGMIDFYHSDMKYDYHKYSHACERIRVLRANSVTEVKFAHNPMPCLEKIEIENDIFYSKDNCLIRKDSNELFIGTGERIPDGVTNIREYAYSHSNIKRIVLPPSVATVDRYAFVCCDRLESVELGEGVARVEKYAFYKCRAIKRLTIKYNNLQTPLFYYDKEAFAETTGLTEARIPTRFIEYLHDIAPETITTLAFTQGYEDGKICPLNICEAMDTGRWSSVRELIIGADMQEISDEAFMHLGNRLETITVEDGCENFYSVNNCLISRKDQGLLLGCKNSVIPTEGVKKIYRYAFSRCVELEKIIIPKQIECIGDHAFELCKGLCGVVFKPKNLYVEPNAFTGCTRKLETVEVDDIESWFNYRFDLSAVTDSKAVNPLLYATKFIVGGKKTEDLVVPNISEIGIRAFNYTRSIKTVYIPPTVKRIGEFAFAECPNLSAVYIDNLAAWCNIDFINYSSNPLPSGPILYLADEPLYDLVIGEDIPVIKRGAFIQYNHLRSLTLNANNITIEWSAFAKCRGFKRVIMSGTDYNINPGAFRGCDLSVSFPGTKRCWIEKYSELMGISTVDCSDGRLIFTSPERFIEPIR